MPGVALRVKLGAEQLLAAAADGHAPQDRRIAAAVALSSADELHRRIRIAVEATADEARHGPKALGPPDIPAAVVTMGPTLLIYAPAAPDADQLDALLQREAIDVTRSGGATWSFWLAPSTCQVSVAVVPFGTESDGCGGSTEPQLEPIDQQVYLGALGFLPVATIQIDNYCRHDPLGHSLLGRLAARLAGVFSGIIDVGGALLPASVVSTRPGAIRSAVLSSGTVVHLVAPEVLEASIRCEDFYFEI